MSSMGPQILRPKPRRPFDNNLSSPQPPSPSLSPSNFNDTLEPPSRTHSILNLTSSTLMGIYSPTEYQTDQDEPSNPWGTGAESPLPTPSPLHRIGSSQPISTASGFAVFLSLSLRSTLLFGLGMLYGLLVRHLHDDRQLAPFQVEGIIKPSRDWQYLAFWGVAGMALGTLQPWFDAFWTENLHGTGTSPSFDGAASPELGEENTSSDGILGADWTPVIRSIGAFVGIAFAIRKSSWTSSLQVSLTLALVNPVLWYIIDRSKPGFVLSSAVGATGAALLLASNADVMPNPAAVLKNSTIGRNGGNGHDIGLGQLLCRERVESGIWIISVLFCSCVCFGNIGRRLALNSRAWTVTKINGRDNLKGIR